MNKPMSYIVIFTITVLIGTMMAASAATEYQVIDAEIILPDYTPPEVYTTPAEIVLEPTLSPIDILKVFLAEDTTNDHEYNITGDYVCIDFSIDLAHNMTDAGFDAGCVNIVSKYRYTGGWHVINWVKIENQTFHIEPQNDEIFTPEEYLRMINDTIHLIREISVESAERNRADQRRWDD